MNPLNCNDSKTNEIRNDHLQDDENIESVYNEIDELAMNTSRRSYHHSYLEITNSLSSTLHTKGSSTPSSICSTHLSSKSQPVQQKTLRRQRNELKEHTNDQHSPEGSEYSDEHIRPTSFVQLQPIEIMLEHRGISLPNNDTVTGIQNEYSISKESTLIGFGRSTRINKLSLKDVRSQTRRINVVDNPIYHETVNRHPKSAAWFSKRKTL
ncbi:unnamed protein product [Mytilus coruscus]|uniref:Uncharacterized protein n=1 Tax=Mytilus coruscus TaxID=42192 RepID=A0A6J8EJG5_MYTCO|nr:unnamed protein product [Mytilus coruscus]